MPAPNLPLLSVARSIPRKADVLIAGFTGDAVVGVPDTVATAFRKRFGSTPAEFATGIGASTAAQSASVLPSTGPVRLVLVGLGAKPSGHQSGSKRTRKTEDAQNRTTEELRAAAGAGVRAALGLDGVHRVAIGFDRGDPEAIQAIGEGALLGTYRFAAHGSAEPRELPESITVLSRTSGKQQLAAVDAAQAIAAAVLANRDWVNQPPNLLYPESFAADAIGQLAGTKIKTELLDEKALTNGGYGGLLAVGGGSERPPRLLRMSYAPRGAKTHLALVGKGITFDSGGLDIKPPTGMLIMKSDMSGAAAVIAAIGAVARLGLKIKITAYASLAENMPSGSAYRPSDVLTIYGGTTVENFNTDAEGRLVMADALVRATEDEPDLIVDVATLTGACIIALGERTGGVLGSDQAAADRVLAAAGSSGERFWQLPIPPESREHLESEVADLKSGRSGPGGALTAAAFLREFTGGIPWVHLDIAGPSFHEGKPYGYVSSGGTGIGVRTLVQLSRDLAT